MLISSRFYTFLIIFHAVYSTVTNVLINLLKQMFSCYILWCRLFFSYFKGKVVETWIVIIVIEKQSFFSILWFGFFFHIFKISLFKLELWLAISFLKQIFLFPFFDLMVFFHLFRKSLPELELCIIKSLLNKCFLFHSLI